jgi:two-component system, LytTR family, response regulator
MTIYKTVIVDDEAASQKVLSSLIEKNCPSIQIIGIANSVEEGLKTIEALKPDIVFMDVELTPGTGFDILRKITKRDFDVIFVSAHGHYAIKAFKFSAIDFLLKPIDAEDLIQAVDRIAYYRNLNQNLPLSKYDVLLDNLESAQPRKLAISTNEGIEYMQLDEVMYIKAEGSYSEIVCKDRSKRMVSKNLKDFHEKLNESGFFRAHKSYLVNMKYVKKLLRRDGGSIEMADGTIVLLARTQLEAFKTFMKQQIHYI